MRGGIADIGRIGLIAALLAGCAAAPKDSLPPEALAQLYESRHSTLAAIDEWRLSGRLAIVGPDDGGSGSFSWQRQSAESTMNFHGTLGRGAWRLTAREGMAQLEMADGQVYRAGSIGALVRQHVGWDIPVDSLSWWVRGLAAPGEVQHRELDENGALRILRQSDWSIEFERYKTEQGLLMPAKLTARQADTAVKLAIRAWLLPESVAADE